MSDQIDKLFSFDENDDSQKREKEIFRIAKKKSNRKMMVVSLIVVAVVAALCVTLKLQLTPYMVGREALEKDLYYSLCGANSYVSMWDEEYRFFGSSATATQYRLIEGVPVYEGQISLGDLENPIVLNRGASQNWEDNQYENSYYLNGNKAMQFFVPAVKYPTYVRDFDKLGSMPENTVAEMGISFDGTYTLEQITASLPDGVTLAWNWVDAFSEDSFSDDLQQVFWGHEILGFSMTDQAGVLLNDPAAEFVAQLQFAMAKGGERKGEFASAYNLLGGESLATANLPIIGAVVTGSPQDLAALEGLAFIKGASLGETVAKY